MKQFRGRIAALPLAAICRKNRHKRSEGTFTIRRKGHKTLKKRGERAEEREKTRIVTENTTRVYCLSLGRGPGRNAGRLAGGWKKNPGGGLCELSRHIRRRRETFYVLLKISERAGRGRKETSVWFLPKKSSGRGVSLQVEIKNPSE